MLTSMKIMTTVMKERTADIVSKYFNFEFSFFISSLKIIVPT